MTQPKWDKWENSFVQGCW